jgi:monoamine oxidase
LLGEKKRERERERERGREEVTGQSLTKHVGAVLKALRKTVQISWVEVWVSGSACVKATDPGWRDLGRWQRKHL